MSSTLTPTSQRATRWVLLVLAIAQIATTVAIQLAAGGPGGRGADLLISPAPYAFAIWGLIYLAALVHAVGVVKYGTAVADTRALVAPLAVLYAAAAAWSVASLTGNSWLTFAILAVMAVAAIRACVVAMTYRGSGSSPRWLGGLERASVGVFAGWATLAVFINFASAVVKSGWANEDSAVWQLVVLVVALGVATAVLWTAQGAPGYSFAAGWGLVGIVVTTWGVSTAVAVTAALGVIVVGAVCATAVSRSRGRG